MTTTTDGRRRFGNPQQLHAAIHFADVDDLPSVLRDAQKIPAGAAHMRTCETCIDAHARAAMPRTTGDLAPYEFALGRDDVEALARGRVPAWLAAYARVQLAKAREEIEEEQPIEREAWLSRHDRVQEVRTAMSDEQRARLGRHTLVAIETTATVELQNHDDAHAPDAVRRGFSLHELGCPRANPDVDLPDDVACTCRRSSDGEDTASARPAPSGLEPPGGAGRGLAAVIPPPDETPQDVADCTCFHTCKEDPCPVHPHQVMTP